MKPLKQKYLHIPDKQHGDCWRTCIASILECDVDLFPYHNGDISWAAEYDEMIQILESMGYGYGTIPINYVVQGVLDCPDTDGYCIAIGKSNRGVNHSVIWKNGIVHDPHPDNTGISDIIRFEILTKQTLFNHTKDYKPTHWMRIINPSQSRPIDLRKELITLLIWMINEQWFLEESNYKELLDVYLKSRPESKTVTDKKYQDTEADGYVFCGKCGKMK